MCYHTLGSVGCIMSMGYHSGLGFVQLRWGIGARHVCWDTGRRRWVVFVSGLLSLSLGVAGLPGALGWVFRVGWGRRKEREKGGSWWY